MKPRKGHRKLLILLLLSIEILIILGFLAYIQLRPMVVETITMEAGTELPDINKFLLFKSRKGSFLTDVHTIDLAVPGVYDIKIKVGSRAFTSRLQVVDTTAPTARTVNQMCLREEDIKAEAFVTDIKDASTVSVSYKTQPLTSVQGDQEVTVILEDSGKNCTELKANLTVLDIKNTVTIEAGSTMYITTRDFVDNDDYEISFVTDLTTLDISKPAVHKIIIKVNGREVSGSIEVVDTTAPMALFQNKSIWNDQVPPASDFVSDIRDISAVEATYKTPPDLSKLGEQSITIILQDEYGNRTEQQVTATVMADTEPPEIIGAADKTVYIGDSVAYRKGVTVKDNKDEELEVSVDSSEVNLKKEGEYTVVYTAEDKAGNKTSVSTTVTVKKITVSEEDVNKLADDILDDILKKDMTKEEEAHAIYKWVKGHVSYTGDSDKSDWLAEAYRGMTKGDGDCFTYYAVSQALLTRAGIDNMRVTRVGGRTQHFWNLINCGSGWYHFDTCPNKDHMEAFMLTDKEVEEYTKKRGNNYYSFDKSLYPATPEE
jgi:hypothetical protein